MEIPEDDPSSLQSKPDPEVNDWKRTKWQPKPSHHSLMPTRPKVVHKASTRNQITTSDRYRLPPINDCQDQDEGFEGSEFVAFADTFAHHFSKNKINPSFENIAEVVSTPKINRLDSMARADMCPIIRRPRLVTIKGVGSRIREQYGYEISNTTYLYAEEALYLVEIGKLQLYLGNINLSIERARSLLLHSKTHPKAKPSKIKSCSVDEYIVYKHLSKLGYRLRRRDQHDIKLECLKDSMTSEHTSPGPGAVGNEKDTEMQIDGVDDGMMDVGDDEPIRESGVNCDFGPANATTSTFSSPSSGLGNSVSDCLNKRGVKRKFGEFSSSQNAGSTTPSSSAKDISDDEDADVEFDFVPAVGDVYMDSVSDIPANQPLEGYVVTEADSDVEIIDEVMNNGVKIEEIRYDYDGDIEDDVTIGVEPQPSTSTACFPAEGLVDLAESDPEKEQEIQAFSKIWSKFVPNVTIQIGFPPAALLPSNIPFRHEIYEFDLKNKGERSDSELEYYVDELNLNSSPAESENENDSQNKHQIKRAQCKSWKAWRQVMMEEARDVLNDSLLARPNDFGNHCDNAMKKLYLWDDKGSEVKRQSAEGWARFLIPFDLYPPVSGGQVHKNRLKTDFQPCYVVAVVRNYDLVPSFSTCEPSLNGVPVLVAAVTDEAEILFMTPDRSPVPSLF